MSFVKEAWPFVAPFVVACGVLSYLRMPGWAIAAGVLAVAILLFFRDPKRHWSGDAATVLAAADGLVTNVDVVEDAAVGPGRWNRVVTFLSVFDVHVQRTPVAGKVIVSELSRGRKVAAFRADADEVNEQHLTVLERPNGERVGIRQITGLVARRVVCYLESGQSVERGEHLGVIKFGSRVDVLVPIDYEILVKKGERLKNGASPIARPSTSESSSAAPPDSSAGP